MLISPFEPQISRIFMNGSDCYYNNVPFLFFLLLRAPSAEPFFQSG